MMGTPNKIRVLVVDDSAVVREALVRLIEKHPAMEVMATANDPFEAAERIRREVPDVITLDIEMPKMDGITFLKRLMSQRPVPVIVCSSLVGDGTKAMMAALEGGAIDVIQKPNIATKKFLEESAIQIQDKIIAAASSKTSLSKPSVLNKRPTRNSCDLKPSQKLNRNGTVIAIGASTGGTEAIKSLLLSMPPNSPPLLIVQHMPANFTAAFAQHLDNVCRINVREAADNVSPEKGLALIAPGDRHMSLARSGASFRVKVAEGPLVSRHRPSVDVLFNSTAETIGSKAIGIILTGMGRDGASGIKAMRDAGGVTIGQDEKSCVVYGMSRVAKSEGGIAHEMDLQAIPDFVSAHFV